MFCPQAVLLAGFFVEKHNGGFVVLCVINPNRSLETELALFLMTAIRKMWLYIVGS